MTKLVFAGTGRRKSSVARVRLTPGKGNILVNGRDFQKVSFVGILLATVVTQPFEYG